MEKNQTMTDEQLARELQNGKRGGGRGKLLTVIGCAATAIGIFTSVTALTVIGIVVALLGQGVLNKHRKSTGKAVFESLVPEIMNANFEDVQPIGKQNLVDIKGSNIRCRHTSTTAPAAASTSPTAALRPSSAPSR